MMQESRFLLVGRRGGSGRRAPKWRIRVGQTTTYLEAVANQKHVGSTEPVGGGAEATHNRELDGIVLEWVIRFGQTTTCKLRPPHQMCKYVIYMLTSAASCQQMPAVVHLGSSVYDHLASAAVGLRAWAALGTTPGLVHQRTANRNSKPLRSRGRGSSSGTLTHS